MDLRRNKMGLVALMGTVLLLAVLASLVSTSWATPEQRVRADGGDTIPDKFCDDTWVARGDSTEFVILVNHPISPTDTWYNTVVTDSIDANLEVSGLSTTRGSAAWTNHAVTFTLGTMLPGDTATLKIYVMVNDDAPQGYEVYNTAYMSHTGWGPVESDHTWMFTVAYEQYLPLSMRRY